MDLPGAFRFVVRFGTDVADVDASFQEVGGIAAELDIDAAQEGGENRYAHPLPKGVQTRRLTLKRALVPVDSKLVQWCRKVLEGGLDRPVDTRDLQLTLLDHEGQTLRHGSFTDACPVRWEVESVNSTIRSQACSRPRLLEGSSRAASSACGVLPLSPVLSRRR